MGSETPHDPVAALREIASLLERERASRYRSKAFRTAADAIEGVPAEVLRNPAAVQRIAGVGASSAAVIAECMAGRVPAYLADLREATAPSTSALRRLLRGDLHTHTDWSDGQTSLETMVAAARELGHEYVAITDHSPRLRVAHGLSAERLRAQREAIARVDAGPLAVLSGIEVDILDDGSLDQEDELLRELDVVVASAHSKLRMDRVAMTRRLVTAASDPRVDVLGHVTGRLIRGERGTRPPSEFDASAVFAACARAGTAVEINSRPEREDPPDELIALALDAGCLFSIDSDAHAPGQLRLLDEGAARAERAGVPPARIVTTWPLERLREWVDGRRSR